MLDHYLPRYPQLCQLCVSLRLLHVHLNTFLVFWEHAERVKNTQKEIFTFNNAWEL
jgi:hypothetical protein